MKHSVVYLDHQSTTPVDRAVRKAMMPFLTTRYANPSSPHQLGRDAAEALQAARRQVQISLGAGHAGEIVFTSGATEANHLAILGAAAGARHRSADHVVVSAIEHPSVLSACDHLRGAGYTVTTVPVDHNGLVDPAGIVAMVTPRTALVSVMYANHEVGTIQPIPDIVAAVQGSGVVLHVDATQAVGAVELDVARLGVDLLTVSAHKIYGPKGTGALYVRRGTSLRTQYAGSSQEQGVRAGTVNVAGAVGLAEALRILDTRRGSDTGRIARQRDDLASRLLAAIPDARVNGSHEHRLPANLSLTIPGVDATDLIEALPDVAISAGSACASGTGRPSHVLTAIGLSAAYARSTIRVSLGRGTQDSEVTYAVDRISVEAARLLQAVRTA